jgi:hypothetical protein
MKINLKYLSIILLLILTILILFLFNKKEPESKSVNQEKVSNIKKPIDTSNWTDYTNKQLGFSIKIPPKVFMIGCRQKEPTYTPIRILEDNTMERVYIFEDYYNDNSGQCVKIINSLEDIRQQTREAIEKNYYPSPHLGWSIIINDIENEQDILKHIKTNFGSECIINTKDLQEDGNYKIYIKGNQKEENDPWWGNCYLNFAHKIIYSPEKHKLMSVVLGQECKFNSTNPELLDSSYQCFDDEIIKSFKFE